MKKLIAMLMALVTGFHGGNNPVLLPVNQCYGNVKIRVPAFGIQRAQNGQGNGHIVVSQFMQGHQNPVLIADWCLLCGHLQAEIFFLRKLTHNRILLFFIIAQYENNGCEKVTVNFSGCRAPIGL